MLRLTFFYAFSLLALGVLGLSSAPDPGQIRALGLPGLFFGGTVLFCSFFALREPRHGLAGASFLAFLALLTTGGTLAGHLIRHTVDWSQPARQVDGTIFLLSVLYLAAGLTAWKRARRARAIAELEGRP